MLGAEGGLPEQSNAQWDEPLATQENIERFYVHLEETMSQIGFLNPAAPRQLMPRMRRLYNRLGMDEMELNILRGILTETQKRCEPVDWSTQNGGKS
jgi:tRNA C32,U32 (ribose-2'-O)-methylase TrmJ